MMFKDIERSINFFPFPLTVRCESLSRFPSQDEWKLSDFIITQIGVVTLTTLKYFCINHGDQRGFLFEVVINVLVSSFRFMLWI